MGQASVASTSPALENLLWPELFILGGGISKKPDKWVPLLTCRTPLKVAELINNAGIVGAALAASRGQPDHLTRRQWHQCPDRAGAAGVDARRTGAIGCGISASSHRRDAASPLHWSSRLPGQPF